MFITWLVIHRKLPTVDRLAMWKAVQSTQCSFCNGTESIEHLFFSCPFAAVIWQSLLKVLGIHRAACGFSMELQSAIKFGKKVGDRLKLYEMSFAETIYQI